MGKAIWSFKACSVHANLQYAKKTCTHDVISMILCMAVWLY